MSASVPAECRSRLRNLLTDFSTVGLYGVTITRQQILKSSLQVTVVGVFPYVTRAATAGFFHLDLLSLVDLGV